MDVYRTPDERFENLPGYPFEPHYSEIDGMRMHYVDEGHGDPILLLHGEPDWSYLYRKMIPQLATAFRVIAPDYFGFGKSDKPSEIGWYTYQRHTDSIKDLITSLDLHGITVVVQDWGGPIGLRVATEMSERFARLVVLNTGLMSPGEDWPSEGFMNWRNFAERVGLEMPVGKVMQSSCTTQLDAATLAAYDAPFPTRESKAGVAAFPLLVPIREGDAGAAEMVRVKEFLASWDVPAIVIFSDGDPVFRPDVGHRFAKLLPGAHDRAEIIESASHMLQEDKGEEIASRILEWVGAK
ncbi:MAG TPA: haloalkane dehalogenase [Candidatus Dormibacteraeota bacterium]|nr:haloalkane dehalogenase [Candidatus Dormibacteraeota bacterium]